MRQWKRLLCLGLACAAAVVLQFQPAAGQNVWASELTNDKIKETEAEIADAKEMKKQLQNDLTDVKKIKEELEQSKASLSQYVAQLDGELEEAQDKIEALKDQIAEKEEELAQTKQELEAALEDQEQQYAAMKKRIQFMYESGDALYMELLFTAAGFSDMLNKAEYIEMLSAYDREQLDAYVDARRLIELYQEQLEEEKSYLEEARAVVEKEEEALHTLIEEKERTITAVTNDINNKEAAIAAYEADIKEQNETIAVLERIVAEEKERLEEEQRRRYDGGMFAWPAPSYTRISDDYGNRIHPILNVKQFHNGVDMAAPGGTPILAAYDGEVVASAYSGSMGNYIMIDHGDGLYTIYMHAASLLVSKGATVTKGQKIATVGTTGRSTGNHLHFSVRLNGSYVSPWNYLGG